MSEAMERRDEAFVIDNDAKAEWAMRRIREIREECDKWNHHYVRMMADNQKRAEDEEAYFMGLLEAYFAQVPHRVTRTQESYTLPSGKIMRKAQQPAYDVDDQAALRWLQAHGGEAYIRMKLSIDWAKLKAALDVAPDGSTVMTETGEVVEGVTITERGPKFCVQLNREGADP